MPSIHRISRKVIRNVAAHVTRQLADAAIVGAAADSLDRAKGPDAWQEAAQKYRQRTAIADAVHDFALETLDRYLKPDNEKDDEP
jgi:hypothetical protein